ncbi:retrovirus-related Pol polyprotein from transposon 297 [Trichonephila clavipes]|nr:retrovirus-related Pol polyprotein from transposon 297 [Trichonephila clavipes]
MRLMTSPILKQANGSKPFTIRTDASNYALGVLLQSDPDEHVIEYASRLMIAAERNCSTTEWEAFAVVWVLEKFRGYVKNQQIFLASDHQPLKWLLSIKSPSGRLARWVLKILSFNLKIDYTPGKANVEADMLSRPLYTEGAASDVCAITVDMPSRKSIDIRKSTSRFVPKAIVINQQNKNQQNTRLRTKVRDAGYCVLFGPLAENPTGKKWIFIVEDKSTKWIELFALAEATAENCAKTLIEEVLLRYGLPRKLISDKTGHSS